MSNFDIVIANSTVVTPGGMQKLDIGISRWQDISLGGPRLGTGSGPTPSTEGGAIPSPAASTAMCTPGTLDRLTRKTSTP